MNITEHFHDGVLVLTISGRLNFYSRKTFRAVMKNAETGQANRVILNLEEVDGIDSVGLGLVVLSQHNLSLRGKALSLVGPGEAIREVLESANIPQLIPTYVTEHEAMGSPVTLGT